MKVIKNNRRDKSVPVDISHLQIDEEDCFGKEWESTCKSCTNCSEYEVCMVLFMSKNKKKIAEIKKQSKFYFDELDWELVPWKDVLEQIKENPGIITLLDLRATVKALANCIDDFTVNMKVQNWLIENNIKVKGGCLYLS